MNIQENLRAIELAIDNKDRTISRLVESKDALHKAAAVAKTKLEQALKKPELLNEAVYAAIDLLRAVTPYSNDWGKSHTIDPPLTDAEKTLK
jgi:tryptophan 2,3-dioxygenase